MAISRRSLGFSWKKVAGNQGLPYTTCNKVTGKDLAMSSTTVNQLSVGQQQRPVAFAFREVLTSMNTLLAALWYAARQARAAAVERNRMRRDIARARAYAGRYRTTNPHFAEDLLAAADRYEQSQNRI
jgi:hypothetical protein